MPKIIIPTPLRKFTNNSSSIETLGESVVEAVQHLTAQYPELGQHLFDPEGKLRKFVRIYVGDQDIRELNDEQTKLSANSIVSIIPAIAGGLNTLTIQS